MNIFLNKELQENFEDFVEKNKFECHSLSNSAILTEKAKNQQISFIMDTLFNDDAQDDIFEFNDYILENDDAKFDSIYTNFVKNSNNVVFLKVIDSGSVDEISNLITNYFKEMQKFLTNRLESNFLSNSENEVLNNLLENLKNETDSPTKLKLNSKNVTLYFIVNLDEVEMAKLKNKQEFNIDSNYSHFIKILNNALLLNKVNDRKSSKTWVTNGKLEIDKENNYLLFQNNNSLNTDKNNIIDESVIVNVKGTSINKLWKDHNQGLLNLNLRYYVKNTKVDDSIKKTINETPDKFWYLNNGLLILCRDFKIEKNIIQLKDFSIVNGGQTTSLLGSFDNKEINDDLYLVAKIIKLKSNDDANFFELANEIAEASNKQKPIKDKDLVANISSLNQLKNKMLDFNNPKAIYINTRRGDFTSKNERVKNKFNEKYTVVESEVLLQSYSAFIDFIPGTARNLKSHLYFDDNATKVFNVLNNNLELTYDLNIINYVFVKNVKTKVNLKAIKKDAVYCDNELLKKYENVAKYMGYVNIALVKLLILWKNLNVKNYEIWNIIKIKYNNTKIHQKSPLEFNKLIKEFNNFLNDELKKLKIKRIFKPNTDVKRIITLYNKAISSFTSIFYNSLASFCENNPDLSQTQTNFTKTNDNFYKYILNVFLNNEFDNFTKANEEFIELFYYE